MLGIVVSTLFPQDQSALGVKASIIWKESALRISRPLGKVRHLLLLWATQPDDDSNNEDDGILNFFTATVNPTEGIVEDVDDKDDLVDSKFEKMDNQDDIHTAYKKLYEVSKKHEKLYKLATKKLSDVELDREEFFTKFDEANRTIGALRFDNNFLAEKTEKFAANLFQVLRRLRSLRQSYSKLELSWRGLQVKSLMRCLAFKNLLLIKPV